MSTVRCPQCGRVACGCTAPPGSILGPANSRPLGEKRGPGTSAAHLRECRPDEGCCAEGCPRYPMIESALRPPEHPAAQGQESSVVDDLLDAMERLAQEDALIVVHPKNNTPELREAVHATPKAELWVSKFLSPGVSLVIDPKLIEDMKLVVPRV